MEVCGGVREGFMRGSAACGVRRVCGVCVSLYTYGVLSTVRVCTGPAFVPSCAQYSLRTVPALIM